MSQITITEKNFERFSQRMRKLLEEFTQGQVSLGKLESQELLSKILGSENTHELRKNLKKNIELYNPLVELENVKPPIWTEAELNYLSINEEDSINNYNNILQLFIKI